MFAVQGDILTPASDIMGTEWFGFDVAIISMALHDVVDPIALLNELRERVKSGGVGLAC